MSRESRRWGPWIIFFLVLAILLWAYALYSAAR